jgi:hypothetical protein
MLKDELHYANLTEYVAETENKDFGKRCHNWFHIANRPAPGYIDLLANGLFTNKRNKDTDNFQVTCIHNR